MAANGWQKKLRFDELIGAGLLEIGDGYRAKLTSLVAMVPSSYVPVM